MTLTSYTDRRKNMKISKMAIAVLFAAGFLTTSATASMATSCAEGYTAVEGEETGMMYTCEPIESVEGEVVEPVEGDVDVKPIDSCWSTDDGIDVCARGAEMPITAFQTEPEAEPIESVEGDVDVKPIDSCWSAADGTEVCSRSAVPMPAEGAPVDSDVCDPTGLVDAEGNQPEQCFYDMPSEAGVEGELLKNNDGVDETLMYQSGVASAAPDQTVSNTLAAFGVLVGVLGAFGIAISRQRASK